MFVEHLYDSTRPCECRDPLEHMFHVARFRLKLDVSSGRPPMHICVHAHNRRVHDRATDQRSPPRDLARYQRQTGLQRLSPLCARDRIIGRPGLPVHGQAPPGFARVGGLPRARTRTTARPRPDGQGAPNARDLPLSPGLVFGCAHRNPRLARGGGGHRDPPRGTHRGRIAHHGRTARRGRLSPTHLHNRPRRPVHARGLRPVHDRRRHL